MLPRFIILPAAASLLAAALAGCTERTAEPPQTIASTAQPPGDTGPRASERDAVLRGGLAGAGVGDRVFFAYDSSTLGPDALRVLQAQAAWLKAQPAAQLTIEGHADERGTREYNLALGERRAAAVRDYLIASGIASDRLRTLSYGKERPQVVGHDESAWAQNRRGVSVVQ